MPSVYFYEIKKYKKRVYRKTNRIAMRFVCYLVREVTLDLGKNGLKSWVSDSQSIVLTSIKQNINAKISRKTLS